MRLERSGEDSLGFVFSSSSTELPMSLIDWPDVVAESFKNNGIRNRWTHVQVLLSNFHVKYLGPLNIMNTN